MASFQMLIVVRDQPNEVQRKYFQSNSTGVSASVFKEALSEHFRCQTNHLDGWIPVEDVQYDELNGICTLVTEEELFYFFLH